jgi:hypothetical protein
MPLDTPRRRLTIPAPKREANEVLFAAMPFFLRGTAPAAEAAPPLLSFDGADFMERLAAMAGGAAPPVLLPWRDWAEPPRGVLDGAGLARYPATLRRAAPVAVEHEAGLDPDGVPPGDPPWLRKLYLPLHQRFTLIAFDLVCRRLGLPPVDRARVLGAGAVVRRLRPDAARARWEDWISADGQRGVWTELAQPIETLDPEALPASAYAGQEIALRARLGLVAAAALPPALDSARLAPMAPDLSGGRTTLQGYLPVMSRAEQAGESVGSPADLVAALQARTTATGAALAADAPRLAARLAPALSDLLAETVLPPRPSAPSLANAWAQVQGFTSLTQPIAPGGATFASALTLDRALRALLAQGFAVLAPAQVEAAAISPDAPETTTGWLDRAVLALNAAASGPGDKNAAFGSAWGAECVLARGASWRLLFFERLHQMQEALVAGATVAPPLAGQPARLDGDDLGLLLLCALLRLRVLRLSLASTLRRQAFGEGAEMTALTVVQDGAPAATPGVVGQEIAALLALEAWRGTKDAPAWPPLDVATPPGSGDRRAARAHEAAAALEAAFAGFEAAAAPGGSAFDEEQQARLDQRAAALEARLGTGAAAIRAQGIELREQPARGLFGLPGAAPSASALAPLGDAMAARYASQAVALRVARDEARVPRPRYDHESLYAVWCWVRVAGRDACERERLVWTRPTEPFSLAEPSDLLGARPAVVQLPDIPKLIRDLPRMAKARARPIAAFAAPADSSYITGEAPEETKRAWGIGWVCSFGIPVLTICAYILFSIIFAILIVLPGFFWMLLLKLCLPVPKRSS